MNILPLSVRRLLRPVAWVCCASFAFAALRSEPEPVARKAAVFVFSRETKVSKEQLKSLEDLLATRVSSQGFQTLTRDLIVDSIDRSMRQPGTTPDAKNQQAADTPQSSFVQFVRELRSAITGENMSPVEVEKRLEDQLDEQSSVMRLAQTIGADLILVASIQSFGTETRHFKGNELAPIATKTVFNKLLISYRLAFAATGGSVVGNSVRVDRAWRESESLTRDTDNLLNEMLDEAAEKLASQIKTSNSSIKQVPKTESAGVQFRVRLALPGGAPLQLPVFEDGDVKLPVNAEVSCDVSANGVSIGSAPGVLKLATGLQQVSIQATGFKPWKRFINVSAGQAFDAVLEMTPESYAKWKEVISFLEDLSRKQKLTKAEMEIMRSKAEAIKKAGLVVNVGSSGIEVFKR